LVVQAIVLKPFRQDQLRRSETCAFSSSRVFIYDRSQIIRYQPSGVRWVPAVHRSSTTDSQISCKMDEWVYRKRRGCFDTEAEYLSFPCFSGPRVNTVVIWCTYSMNCSIPSHWFHSTLFWDLSCTSRGVGTAAGPDPNVFHRLVLPSKM
jgi:hypothetical protein